MHSVSGDTVIMELKNQFHSELSSALQNHHSSAIRLCRGKSLTTLALPLNKQSAALRTILDIFMALT
jgi:hypothetical protein